MTPDGSKEVVSGANLGGELSLTSYPYPFGRVSVSILDTDFLLNMVKEGVRSKIKSPFIDRVRIPGNAIFASSHVYAELYQSDALGNQNKWEKLGKQSADEGWQTSPKKFQTFFEQHFLPQINFVDVGQLFVTDPMVQKVMNIDYKDAPTAQLAVLLARLSPIVYSQDRSLNSTGFAPARDNFANAVAAHHRIDHANKSIEAISLSTATIVLGTKAAVDSLANSLKVSRWVFRAAALFGIGWLLANIDMRKKITRALAPAGNVIIEQLIFAIRSLPNLKTNVRAVDSIDTIEQCIAEIMVTRNSHIGLKAGEIHESLQLIDVRPIPSVTELRQIIVQSPCFREIRRFRYDIGVNPKIFT